MLDGQSKTYLDDSGNPLPAQANPSLSTSASKVYLDDSGNPAPLDLINAKKLPVSTTPARIYRPNPIPGSDTINKGLATPDQILTGLTPDIMATPPKLSDIDAELSSPVSKWESENPIKAGLRRGALGVSRDTLNTMSSMTSPANLAQIALNLIPGGKAVTPIRKAVNTGMGLAQGGEGGFDYIKNAREPVGNNYSLADDLQRSLYDIAGVSGGAAMTSDIKGIAPKSAAKLMNWKMGVPAESTKFVNPGQAVVESGPFAFTKKGLQKKVEGQTAKVGGQIEPIIKGAAQSGVTANMDPTFDPVREGVARSLKENELGTANELMKFHEEKTTQPQFNPKTRKFVPGGPPLNLSTMPVDQALNLKRGIGRTKWEGQPDADTLENVRRQSYNIAKDTIHQAVPEVAPFDERYAGLEKAADSLEGGSHKENTTPPVPHMSDYITGAGIGGLTGLFSHGNPYHVAGAVGLGLAAKKLLGSTPLVTGAAHILGEQKPLFAPTRSNPAPVTLPQPSNITSPVTLAGANIGTKQLQGQIELPPSSQRSLPPARNLMPPSSLLGRVKNAKRIKNK